MQVLLFKMKNEEKRQKLREALERIVKTSEEISSLMRKVPHQGGIACRSLKRGSRECIVDMGNSFSSTYKSKDGEIYHITISNYYNIKIK